MIDERRVGVNGRSLLESVRFEIIPAPGVLDGLHALPPGAPITVTCHSSRGGLEATLDTACALRERGFHPIPHLAARLVTDDSQLAGLLDRLRAADVTELFVVGGDAERPGGRYANAVELLRDIHGCGGRFRVGVAGYPEGHPLIDDELLLADLVQKQQLSDYLVTQLCFDAAAVARWIDRIRAAGVELPIFLGIPGAVSRTALLGAARTVGVGPSLRFLRRNRGAAQLLRRSGSGPAEVIVARFDGASARASGVAGVHLFTFNRIEETEGWRQQALDDRRRGEDDR